MFSLCSAIAVSTGKHCMKHAMCGTTVCSIHNKTLIASKAKEVKCLDCLDCFECPICCDKIKAVDLCTLPCHKTHVFHKSCIDLWVDESGAIETSKETKLNKKITRNTQKNKKNKDAQKTIMCLLCFLYLIIFASCLTAPIVNANKD